MPIPNYSTPGVYVTQSGTALTSINNNNLNIVILADTVVPASATDTFYNITSTGTVGKLSNPMVITTLGSYTVQGVSGTTTITAATGINFNFVTTGTQTYISTSGVTGTPISGTITATYTHNFGALGSFTSYTQMQNVFGVPVSGTSVTSPVSLAGYLAFLNGASTVSVQPVARVAGSGSAQISDWTRSLTVTNSGSDSTYLSNFVGVDVVVPLYGFVDGTNQLIAFGAGTVASGIKNYLNTQATNGTYQRAFVGVDATSNQVTVSGLQSLANGFSTSRVSLTWPGSLIYNPGLNPANGSSNTTLNVPGYYFASAVAGVFVAQPDVSTPITNKKVAGFVDIPNQISAIDASTSYLPYGILTARKKRDGNIWILHGLTTDITTWLTQEVSISAIGDRLARNVRTDLEDTDLIGGPMTKNTTAAVLGTVQSTLTNAVTTGLIQSYSNLEYTVNAATPTTVNVTFQYAPTYPINYIQVVLSLNTQTGQVLFGNTPSNTVVY